MIQTLLNEVALRYAPKLPRYAKSQLMRYGLNDVDEHDIVQDALEKFITQDAARLSNVVHAVKNLYTIVKFQCKSRIKRRHFNGEVEDALVVDTFTNDALQLQVIKDVMKRCTTTEAHALTRRLQGDKLTPTMRRCADRAQDRIKSILDAPIGVRCVKSDAWDELQWKR